MSESNNLNLSALDYRPINYFFTVIIISIYSAFTLFQVPVYFFFFMPVLCLILLILLFYFIILYWYCHTLTWIRHRCTCVPHPEPPLPPPSPSHPSGSSQCTSPEHPVSRIETRLAIRFTYDNLHVSMPFSQVIPPSPSPTKSKRLFYTSVSLLLSHIQGYCYHLSKFHIYALLYCIGIFLSGLLHSV